MAKTVDAGFEALLTLLSPSSGETQAAASHRASIEACLGANFGMTSFFRSGSFGHHTSVSRYSDVDYFAVIPTGKLKANSSASLQEIRSALANRFPKTGVTVRSPAVVVPFGTQAWERHEITPADDVGKTSGGHRVFDIPNRAEGWMRASPEAHNAWVNATNVKLGNRLKPLIRLVKAWNYFHGAGIRSFYLELRTTEYALSENVIIYRYDIKGALQHLKTKGLAAMQDPASVSGLVHPCADSNKIIALTKIDTAITRASSALAAEQAGRIGEAFQWWDRFFNYRFPSYS
jgi:hypothetical protein